MSIDTRTCKFCGIEFNKIKTDEGTFDEGYCCKFHRKDHEKQLIKEGKMKVDDDDDDKDFVVLKDTKYRDGRGERVWFPKDGRPYFDKALRKTFNSIQEKTAYMKEKKIIMDGSSALKKYPIEAGELRDKSYRKNMRLED